MRGDIASSVKHSGPENDNRFLIHTFFGISSRISVHLLTLVLWLRSSLAYFRNYGGIYPENHK